jgi:hypothetical protein
MGWRGMYGRLLGEGVGRRIIYFTKKPRFFFN